MYYMNISPSEVDNLSTYEMREYLSLLDKKRESEVEENTSIMKSFGQLFRRSPAKR